MLADVASIVAHYIDSANCICSSEEEILVALTASKDRYPLVFVTSLIIDIN